MEVKRLKLMYSVMPCIRNSTEVVKYDSIVRDIGVEIQCMLCGGMATPGLQRTMGESCGNELTVLILIEPTLNTPHPDTVAEIILNRFGSGGSVIVPYFMHAFQTYMLELLPYPLDVYVIRSISSFFKSKLEKRK